MMCAYVNEQRRGGHTPQTCACKPRGCSLVPRARYNTESSIHPKDEKCSCRQSVQRERERETRGGSTGVQGGPERVVSGAGGATGGVCEAGGATNKPCRFALQRKAAAMVLVPTPLSSGVPLRLLVRQDFLSQLGQYHLDPEFSY
jgi:hypothetical protein